MKRFSRKHQYGFTAVELGVVIGVLAVLMTVVFSVGGFVEGARIASAIQSVDTIRQAARIYSERQRGGADFQGISMANLGSSGSEAVNVVPDGASTPWGGAFSVAAAGGLNDRFTIGFCAPNDKIAADLSTNLNRIGVINAADCGSCTNCGLELTTE